ncbi:hypothetical protein D9M68_988900 [compost metagenome]
MTKADSAAEAAAAPSREQAAASMAQSRRGRRVGDMASVPVRGGGRHQPWGVNVIATPFMQ